MNHVQVKEFKVIVPAPPPAGGHHNLFRFALNFPLE